MNAYDDLLAAGMLHFDAISCSLEIPAIGKKDPSDVKDLCVPKTPGEARFTIACNQLVDLPMANIPFDTGEVQETVGFDFPIDFVADPPTILGNGDAVVHWKVEQSVNRHVEIYGYSGHLDKVKGGLTTLVKQRRPFTPDAACSMGALWTGADLTTTAGENTLAFSGTVSAEGSDHDVTIEAKSFAVTASAAEEVEFDVVITEIRDGCRIGAAAGGTPRFHALITGTTPVQTVQYDWQRVSGVGMAGPNNLSIFRVELPDPAVTPAQSFTITLHVVVNGVPADGKLDYVPSETADSIAMKQFLCKFHRLWQSFNHPYANPLWDPLRDLVKRPITPTEIEQIGRAGAMMVEIADGMRRVQARIGNNRFGG